MFGMGTGGSLRLLSPERSRAPAFCCRAFGFRQSAFELPPDLPSFRARFRLPPDVGSAIDLPPDFLRPGFRFEVPLSIPFLQFRASHPQNRTGRNFRLRLTMTSTSIPLTFSHKLSLVSVSGLGLRSCLTLSHSAFPDPWSLFPNPSFQDQALDRLVSSSSIRYRTSTDDLSTLSSSRGLTSLRCGNSILWVGFTLRCLQRLSLPHFASLLCHWHDNSCTRGASIPVLSY